MKVKLLIYWSIYIPALTCGYELWVVTEKLRLRRQTAEMSFLQRVFELSLTDKFKNLVN